MPIAFYKRTAAKLIPDKWLPHGSDLFCSQHAAVDLGRAVQLQGTVTECVTSMLVVPVPARPGEPSIDHLVAVHWWLAEQHQLRLHLVCKRSENVLVI